MKMRSERCSRILWLTFVATACAWRSVEPKSSIDALYRWRRVDALPMTDPGSASVGLYRGLLRASFGGRCSLLPSDSELAQWRFRRCEPIAAVSQTMARTLLEPSAPSLGMPLTIIDGQVRYIDVPRGCEYFE